MTALQITRILRQSDYFVRNSRDAVRIGKSLAGLSIEDMRAAIAAALPSDSHTLEPMDDYRDIEDRLYDTTSEADILSILAQTIAADSKAASHWTGSAWADAIEASR